jgi:hypothetical protein
MKNIVRKNVKYSIKCYKNLLVVVVVNSITRGLNIFT